MFGWKENLSMLGLACHVIEYWVMLMIKPLITRRLICSSKFHVPSVSICYSSQWRRCLLPCSLLHFTLLLCMALRDFIYIFWLCNVSSRKAVAQYVLWTFKAFDSPILARVPLAWEVADSVIQTGQCFAYLAKGFGPGSKIRGPVLHVGGVISFQVSTGRRLWSAMLDSLSFSSPTSGLSQTGRQMNTHTVSGARSFARMKRVREGRRWEASVHLTN